MTESVRERMARAVYDSMNGYPSTGECERAVDAILDVLAEPTMDMGLAGADPINEHMRGDVKADYFAAIDSFKAMLTAIREGA